MAVQKNTNDLLTQAASSLPNNTTQQISPLDVREMAENLAASMFNKITDAPLVGLKAYNTLVTYESGQGCTYLGAIYIANQVTGPGAFNAAHWTLFVSGSGTVNKLAKFSATGGPVADSSITDNGVNYLFSLLNTNGFVKTSGGTGLLSVSAQVAATEGGTGKSSWVAGSIPYISATNTFGEVAVGTNGHFLSLVAGVPTWAAVSANNLGNANLTADANVRSYTLNGATPLNYLEFLSPTGSILKLSGDKIANFGDGSTYIKLDPYGVSAFGILQFCAAGTSTAYNVYDSALAERFRVETSGMVYAKRGSLSTYFNYNTSINLWAEGTSGSFHFVGTNGSNHTVYLGNDSGHGYAEIKNSSGATKSRISGNGDSYFLNNLGVGLSTALARFHAKGSGNTPGTSTAIFQNSDGGTALEIKDDKSATFGGDVVLSQSTNSTATGANARITDHPTSTVVVTNASLTSIGSIIAGVAGGHLLTIMNETGAAITIVDAYGSAAAGEVIYTNTASNLTIRNNCGATFQYNATGACWTKI